MRLRMMVIFSIDILLVDWRANCGCAIDIIKGDPVVVPAMWKARHVLAPSTDLFNPIILMKVLYLSLKQMVGLERQLY